VEETVDQIASSINCFCQKDLQ